MLGWVGIEDLALAFFGGFLEGVSLTFDLFWDLVLAGAWDGFEA